MIKRVSVLFLISLTLLMTGCSKNEVRSGQAEAKVTENRTVSLKWFNFQRELTDLTTNLADAYMEQNPDMSLEVEMIGDGYFDVLKVRAATGDLPDIFSTRGYKGMEMYSSYMEDLSDQPFVDKMVDDIRLGLTLDGKTLGAPFQISGWGVIYNKKIFRENGIEIPTTLTELKDISRRLKSNGVTPFIHQFKDSWMLGHLSGTGISNIENPKDFIDSVAEGDTSFNSSPEMINHLKFFDFLLENGQETPLEDDWNSACAKMGMEKAAMMLEGVWVYDTITAVNPDIELGMFAVPYTEDAEESTIYADFNGLWHVSNSTEYTKEAKEFLNWVVDDSTSQKIIKDVGLIPAYKGYDADTHSIGVDIMSYIGKEKIRPFGWLLAPDAYESEAGKIYQSYILEKTGSEELLESLTELVRDLAMN